MKPACRPPRRPAPPRRRPDASAGRDRGDELQRGDQAERGGRAASREHLRPVLPRVARRDRQSRAADRPRQRAVQELEIGPRRLRDAGGARQVLGLLVGILAVPLRGALGRGAPVHRPAGRRRHPHRDPRAEHERVVHVVRSARIPHPSALRDGVADRPYRGRAAEQWRVHDCRHVGFGATLSDRAETRRDGRIRCAQHGTVRHDAVHAAQSAGAVQRPLGTLQHFDTGHVHQSQPRFGRVIGDARVVHDDADRGLAETVERAVRYPPDERPVASRAKICHAEALDRPGHVMRIRPRAVAIARRVRNVGGDRCRHARQGFGRLAPGHDHVGRADD